MTKQKMQKRRSALLALLLLVCLVLTSCGAAQTPAAAAPGATAEAAAGTAAPAAEASAPDRNETEEVDIATYRDAVQGSGDAFYCWEGAYVWEALTRNNGGVIEPWLAASWEHNDDCTEWTFHLRQDAYFTDGTQFNADACLANIQRWGFGIASTYTTLSIDKSFPNLSDMKKVDDFTVQFTFSVPITTLEYVLSDYGSPMFSPNCFDASTGVISDYAIGTGPYYIADHVDGEYVLLERNDSYYGDCGKVKTFRIRCIPDADTRYSALVSGEVQGLADNGAITMDAAVDLCAGNSSFAMDITPSHMTEYIVFNCANQYLSDVRLRQAMSYAIDRDAICSTIYGGILEPAYSFLSTQSVFHKDIQGSCDMGKAKELAAEVLQGKTIDLTMVIRSSSASDYNLKAVGEYLKQLYAELGINVSIELLDSTVYNDRRKEGSYDMNLTVFGINNADPTSTFQSYFSPTGSQNGTYSQNYQNDEIDKLLALAPTIADVNERAKIYNELQDICYEEMAIIPICYQVNVNIHNVSIKNYAGRTFGVGLPTIEWAE